MGTEITALQPEADATEAEDLPDDLVIEPGVYRVHGRTIGMEAEGLYRFIYPGKENVQRIVYRSDVTAFVSAVCWIHSHGCRDDDVPHEDRVEMAKTGKLIMICGHICDFAAELFSARGIRCRCVNGRSMEEKDGGFNTGHVVLEVCLDGRWVAYDIDTNALYRHAGRQLDLLETVRQIQADDYEVVPLASWNEMASGSFLKDGYDGALWMETEVCGPGAEGWRRWRRRVMGLPIIWADEGGVITCPDSERVRAKEMWPELTWVSEDEYRRR